jgi:hypothetical protein
MKTSRSKSTLHIVTLASLLVSLIAGSVFVTPAHAAATFTVTDCGDSGAAGQLRTLMNAAASGDSINIPACTITITGAAGEDANVSGDLDFTKSLTLFGAGVGASIIDGGALDRVFHVTGAFTVNISGVTVRNGNATSNKGGGIYNNGGTLAITNSAFSGNSADWGGGIYSTAGALTITNSAFSGNNAPISAGGGIVNQFGTAVITNSVFSGNSAEDAAGIYNESGTLAVMNSAFTGNTASGTSGSGGGIVNTSGTAGITNTTFFGNSAFSGGGIVASGNTSTLTTITNSTFSGNSAADDPFPFGGGIRGAAGIMTLRNTIVANSTSGGNCSGAITNGGDNIDSGTTCGWGSTSGSMSSTNPLLGALASNGGPTQTFALLAGSPAIDGVTFNAPNSAPSTDQRGVARPQGGGYDIGAYEYVDTTKPTVNTFTVTTPSNSLNIPITAFTASDDVGVTSYLITTSATVPAAGAAGWTGTAPTTYSVASDGSYTLYPWAKDATGNVSLVFGSPCAVVVDTTKPTVNTFTVTTSSNSLNIPITAFTASDAVGVTGYLITTSSTVPAAGAGGWTGTAPTPYTVASDGSYTLYPWARDAAGNVSAVFGSPVNVIVDTAAPSVTSITRLNPSPTNLASVDFTVTFSEAVTGVDTGDFALTTTGVTGASISGVSGSGSTHTVTVNTGSGNGTIRLDVVDNDSIVDAAGNPLGGTGAGNGNFNNGQTYTVTRVHNLFLPLILR